MHRDALHDSKAKSGVLHLVLERAEARAAPGIAHRDVVQSAHHTCHAGDLSDVGERDRIGGPEPAEARDHARSRSWTSRTLARLKSPGTGSFRALAASA